MKSTASATVRQAVVPLLIAPRSLAAAFARVPDLRRAASVAYPLAAVLSLAVAAILANGLSELAIIQWGARQPGERLRALGFPDGRTPCQSTLQRLFCKVDGQATPARGYPEDLGARFGPVAVPLPVLVGSRGVAIDGKAQWGGSRSRPAAVPCMPRHADAGGRGPAHRCCLAGRHAHRRRALLPASAVRAGAGRGRRLPRPGHGEQAHRVPPGCRGPRPDHRSARRPGAGRPREPARGLHAGPRPRAVGGGAPAGRPDRPDHLPGLARPGASLQAGSHLARAQGDQTGAALRHHQPLARDQAPGAPACAQTRPLGHREPAAPRQDRRRGTTSSARSRTASRC